MQERGPRAEQGGTEKRSDQKRCNTSEKQESRDAKKGSGTPPRDADPATSIHRGGIHPRRNEHQEGTSTRGLAQERSHDDTDPPAGDTDPPTGDPGNVAKTAPPPRAEKSNPMAEGPTGRPAGGDVDGSDGRDHVRRGGIPRPKRKRKGRREHEARNDERQGRRIRSGHLPPSGVRSGHQDPTQPIEDGIPQVSTKFWRSTRSWKQWQSYQGKPTHAPLQDFG